MRNRLLSEEDQSEPPRSAVGWWRAAKELDKNGRLTAEEDLSSHQLTPRLRVLREMERLALVAPEGLDDLRHKLIAYRSGDFWVPTGGMKKEEMEIPGMITIVLVGLSGSGKSSLVNLMYSVLGRSGLIPFTQTSSESSNYTTMYMEEHNVLRSMRSGFCVYDTRGLDCHRMIQGLEEVTTWMVDGVRHYQLCCRPGDDQEQQQQPITQLSSARFAKRMVNCVMVVANLVEIHKGFENGDLKAIGATRDLFLCPSVRTTNENPILILTHGDMLSCEERINGRLKICEYLGIPETTGAYDIACITEQGFLPEESDVPVTAFSLTEAVYRALLRSDRTHLPKKKLKDWVLMAVSWVMCSIAAFFAMLAVLFSKLGCRTKLKL